MNCRIMVELIMLILQIILFVMNFIRWAQELRPTD